MIVVIIARIVDFYLLFIRHVLFPFIHAQIQKILVDNVFFLFFIVFLMAFSWCADDDPLLIADFVAL